MMGLFATLWISIAPAWGAWPDDLAMCLESNDIPCSEQVLDEVNVDGLDDGNMLALVARAYFYAGDYPEAFDTLERALEAGFEDKWEQRALYERTLFATAGWTQAERGRFRIRYRPGVDAVLIDEAGRALQQADRHVSPLLGGPVPGETILEIFPDGNSFIASSSLTRDDVRATGVVALSKWSRLLLTSPRALGRGYDWQDTATHEYIHLVVAYHTTDQAPVWLQEAIAKYLDNRWLDGTDRFQLSVRSQSLLAEALANDELVPFSEMHPSLAKIKVYREDGSIDNQASAERSGLAYAQLSTLMAYCYERAGEDLLLKVLPKVNEGIDPRVALATSAGFTSFDEMQKGWLTWIQQQELIAKRLDVLPTVLDAGTEVDVDPVLSRRKDLARFLRVGDLLFDRGRFRASLIEYDKAQDEDDENSPLLANRLARSYAAMNDLSSAKKLLEESLSDYPGFPLTWKTLGDVHRKQGRSREAVEAYTKAVDLNPYDIDVQLALLELAKERGDVKQISRRDRMVQILRRGGEEQPNPPIHERHGEYELPRSPEAVGAERAMRGDFVGHPAPELDVTSISGEPMTLDSLKGQVVLLDFWATWCGPCRAIMPHLSGLQERYGADGLKVVGITDEDLPLVTQFLRQMEGRGQPISYTIARDETGAKGRYQIRSLPTLFVLDKDGVVQLVHVGAGNMDEVDELVVSLLGIEPTPSAE